MSREIAEQGGLAAKKCCKDVIFGFGTAAASVFFGLVVIPAGVVTPDSVEHLPLSPAFLPYVLTILIGLIGFICAIQALLIPALPQEAQSASKETVRGWPLRLLVVAAAFAGYYWLPNMIGMLPVSMLVMSGLVWFGGEHRSTVILSVSIILPLLVYLFFIWIAQVPMPGGFLEAWL